MTRQRNDLNIFIVNLGKIQKNISKTTILFWIMDVGQAQHPVN